MTTAAAKLRRLQPSKLLDQNQLASNDLDLSALKLALEGKKSLLIDESVLDGEIERTIEGASTVQITLLDRDKKIANSQRLGYGVDIKIDGLWFRLVAVSKVGNQLTLTFEDREVAILRTYKQRRVATRGKLTRAQFCRILVREAKEISIPFVCPEITIIQPINLGGGSSVVEKPGTTGAKKGDADEFSPENTKYTRGPGFGEGTDVMLFNHRGSKTYAADKDQKKNLDIILSTGTGRFAATNVLLAAIAVTVEECSARNLSYSSDGLSAGLFQQIYEPHKYAWGTKAQVMDPVWASNRFFDGAIKAYNDNPLSTPEEIAARAQVWPDASLWSPYRQMAQRVLKQWGGAGSSGGSAITEQASDNLINPLAWSPTERAGAAKDHQFSRGLQTMRDGQEVWQQEDTWTCIGRLADEVGWRRFMVSGSLYFISEPYLFRSSPRMTISERSPGIESIDYRYDVAQSGAECTVRCRFDRWEAPPGSIVVIKETGPVNGRWIVSKMTRPLFDNQGTITLTKPQPKLPEPALDEEDKFLIPGLSRADQDAAEAIHDPPHDYEVTGNAAELAKQLIRLHAQGKYKDDNGQQMSQIRKIAAGKPLRNAGGQMVYEDSRVLGAIIAVINAGYTIGTFAINEDHSHLGVKSQHAKGLAVDISSLGDENGHVAINSYSIRATNLTKAVMNLLAELDVWDMICNGVGRTDPSVQALQYDNGQPRKGGWESDHTNHIHFGISPGARDPSSGD